MKEVNHLFLSSLPAFKKPFYTRLGVKGTKRRQWRVIAARWLSFPGHRTLTLQVCWSDRPPIWSLSVWWLNNHLSWSYNLFWIVPQNLLQQWWKCKRSHFNFSEPWDVSDVFKNNKASFSSFFFLFFFFFFPFSSAFFFCLFHLFSTFFFFFLFLLLLLIFSSSFSSFFLSFFSFYLFLFCFFLFSTSFFSNFLVFFFNFFLFLFILLFWIFFFSCVGTSKNIFLFLLFSSLSSSFFYSFFFFFFFFYPAGIMMYSGQFHAFLLIGIWLQEHNNEPTESRKTTDGWETWI